MRQKTPDEIMFDRFVDVVHGAALPAAIANAIKHFECFWCMHPGSGMSAVHRLDCAVVLIARLVELGRFFEISELERNYRVVSEVVKSRVDGGVSGSMTPELADTLLRLMRQDRVL